MVKGDLSSYVEFKIEDLGSLAIYAQLKYMCTKDRKIKLEQIRIYEKGFHNATFFLEEFEHEYIKIIFSRVHGGNMYLDQTHSITKEAIHVMIGFCQTNKVSVLRKIPKEIVMQLTKSTWDVHAMLVNNIDDEAIKFVTMVIDYRIFNSSRLNSVPVIVVHSTYWMI